jgi:hypothetical protein
MRERGFLLTLIFCFSIIPPGIAPEAGAQGDPFYKGKTIRIMVGSTAGGFYDRWDRSETRARPQDTGRMLTRGALGLLKRAIFDTAVRSSRSFRSL